MALNLYPPLARSPRTELAAGIDAVTTTITVINGTLLPVGPNVATIGLGSDSETIQYNSNSGNILTGCVRGFSPAGSAKAWNVGTQIARVFTAQDLSAIQAHAQLVDGSVHGATAAPTANMIVRRDDSGRAKVAAPAAADDIARRAEVDAHAVLAAPHTGHETPAGAQAKVNTHAVLAAPHTGHETPAGSQGRVDTHNAAITGVHGVGASNVESIAGAQSKVNAHAGLTNNPHAVTAAQVGLGNVTNTQQLPISGGTMTGILLPQNNTSYTTGQARRIILSTADPSGGGFGDVWLRHEP